MARNFIVVAAIMFVIVGMAYADKAPEAAPATEGAAAAPGPSGSEGIGGIGSDLSGLAAGFAEAGPVGGPVPDGVFESTPDAGTDGMAPPPKKGSGSALEVSTFFGVAVTAATLSLYF